MRLVRPNLALPLALFALVASSSQTAHAQDFPGYAANHFNPSERGSRWFVLESLDYTGDGRLAIGAVNDYSYRTLVQYNPDETVRASFLRNTFTTHLGASFTFADRVRLGVNVPIQLFGDGNTAVIGPYTYRGPQESAAVGDVRLGADVRVIGKADDAFRGALGVQVFAPSGSTLAYTGDGEPRVLPRAMVAGEIGPIVYAAQVGVHIRGREQAYANGRIGSALTAGLSAGVLLADRRLLIGPELWGHSTFRGRNDVAGVGTTNTPIEALLGARWEPVDHFRVGAGIGAGLTRDHGAPVARGLLTLEWVPGDPVPEKEEAKEDRDGDGIPDCDDACGHVAGPKSDDPTKNGCPAPDADKDGVADADDACPLAVGVASSDPKKNGCPADQDGDGVVDTEDACPAEAGPKNLDPKKNGCPVRDTDGDGVLDDVDACPDKAGVKTTDPKTNGCPDPDLDKDGIPNEQDACPNDAGKPDPDPKKNGCPKAFLQGDQIKITDQVKFGTASAQIQPGKDSEEILLAVLSVLKAHPEVKKVRVEGHTDNVGKPEANKKLSQARAESVVKWLVAKGLDKALFEAKGFGDEKPLEPNDTDAGKKNNRRVEFHVEAGGAK